MERNAAALEAVVGRAGFCAALRADEAAARRRAGSGEDRYATGAEGGRWTAAEDAAERRAGLKALLAEAPEVVRAAQAKDNQPRTDLASAIRKATELAREQRAVGGSESDEWLAQTPAASVSARMAAGKNRLRPEGSSRREHPNEWWYLSRLEDILDERPGRVNPEEENDNTVAADVMKLFREMYSVGCPPSRGMYVRAMGALARRGVVPLEGALRLFWMRVYRSGTWGPGDGRSAEGETEDEPSPSRDTLVCEGMADALCEGMLRAAAAAERLRMDGGAASKSVEETVPGVVGFDPTPACSFRALAAMSALGDLGAFPSATVANDVLARAARTVTSLASTSGRSSSSTPTSTGPRAGKKAPIRFEDVWRAAREAERGGVGIAPHAWSALLSCAELTADLDTAFEVVTEWKARGGSPDAEYVIGLLEWAAEVGDDEKCRWLEEELESTGKGAYLAALNKPQC